MMLLKFAVKRTRSKQFFGRLGSNNILKWGRSITEHLLFTPEMTQKSEVYRFHTFKINIVTELVYMIIFFLFRLFKTY